MIHSAKSSISKINFLLQIFFLQTIIETLYAQQGGACSSDQNLIIYYQEGSNQPQTACISNAIYGIDFYCQRYYLDSMTGLYNCLRCDSQNSFPIELDSGRNFCGLNRLAIYNQDCAIYADENPQFFVFGLTIYQCKTCKDSTDSLIDVYFLYDFFSNFGQTFVYNTLCTGLPLINGKPGGQECLTYEASSYEYDITGPLIDNLKYLVCGQCQTIAVSMDCSFACGANQYEINYFSAGSIVSVCVSGGGTQSWDNQYLDGYSYNCELYASYDQVNKVLGECITNIIENCYQYDQVTLLCQLCSNSYSLQLLSNSSYGCTPNSISNCAQYDSTTLLCSLCSTSYSLQLLSNSSYGCTPSSISNCAQYDSTTLLCSLCSTSYSLQLLSNSSYGCTPNSISNCAQYDSTTLLCQLCSNSYSLQLLSNSSYGCTPNSISNCAQYDSTTLLCSLCSTSYSLQLLSNSSYGCTPNSISNCAQYDSTTRICSLCSTSYSLQLLSNSSYGCTPNSISNCAQYDSTTLLCSLCSTSYSLQLLSNSSYGCTPNSISNCALYDSTTRICSLCSTSYSLQLLSNSSYGCTPNSISNCAQYDSTTLLCSLCSTSYSLQLLSNSSYGCTPNSISNCAQYDSTTRICSLCSTSYSLQLLSNSSYGCTPNSISNCAQYDSTTRICSLCSTSYSLQLLSNSSYGCTPNSISNCAQYDSTTLLCSLCSTSYSLQLLSNSSYGCTPNSISNCAQYDSTTRICSLCSTSYSLQLLSNSSYGCTPNSISNCAQYDSTTPLLCSLCSTSYSLQLLSNSSYGCTPNSISNCALYDTTTLLCSLCSTSYSLQLLSNSSYGCTPNSISNCAQYDSSNLNCSLCQPQFLLKQLNNGSQSCVPLSDIVQFCQIYILDYQLFVCFSCNQSYNLFIISQAIQICSPIIIDGCSSYQTQLVNKVQKPYCQICQFSTQCIEFCLVFVIYSGKSTCSKCISNYKPIYNQKGMSICVPSDLRIPLFCQQIDTSGQNNKINVNAKVKCLTCAQYYYLNYKQNICIPLVFFCSSYFGTICIKCSPPYQLTNQTCIMPSPSNCDIYNTSNGNCRKCKSQYFLNSQMKCDPFKICPNYEYLNIKTNNCIKGQIQNCLIYLNNDQCSRCQTNYQIDSLGFSCKYVAPSIICPSNTKKIKYMISSRKCVQVDINCKYYLENGYCYHCFDGYYQINGFCYINSQTNNSQSFISTILCKNNEYLVGINCIKFPNNCTLFDKQSNTCQACAKGYELKINNKNGQVCVLKADCPSGQYLFNQICTTIDCNCLNFNFNTQNCEKCAEGFTINGPQCLPVVNNFCNHSRMWFNGFRCIEISQTCQTFNKSSGQCWTCFSPYVIIFPGKCGLNKNLSCPQNTVQIANQLCVPIIQNCKSYHLIYGNCLTCFSGYQINQNLRTCTKIIINN